MKIESLPISKSPKELTVLALITLIIATSTEEGYANQLRTEFYLRYRQRIYEYSLYIANKNFGNSSEWKNNCEDVTQDTFIYAIYNLDKFTFEDKWSEAELNNKIIKWLGKIAEHKLFDKSKKERGDKKGIEAAAFNYDLKKKLSRSKTANEEDLFIMERHILELAMAKIKEREKDIFYTYLKHGCLYGKKYLPNDILESMCEKWGVTESYARLIKSRTFEKLRKLCVEEKNKAA